MSRPGATRRTTGSRSSSRSSTPRGRRQRGTPRASTTARGRSTRMLGADPETVNVNGGAVALGHPIGASGARIVSTMVYELHRNGGGLGLAAICSGGGQGDALLLEV